MRDNFTKSRFFRAFFLSFSFLFLLCSNPLFSQGQGVGFDLDGNTNKQLVKNHGSRVEIKKLGAATIKIYNDSVFLRTIISNKKTGKFNTHLAYGHTYKLVFSHPSCLTMNLVIDSRIPKNEYNTFQTIGMEDLPLIDKNTTGIDTLKYHFAFFRYSYVARHKKIEQDDKYKKAFQEGKIPGLQEYEDMVIENRKHPKESTVQTDINHPDSSKTETKKDSAKKINYIIGKLVSGKPPYEVMKNVRIYLIGDRGEPKKESSSNRYGRFIFDNILLDQDYSLTIDGNELRNWMGKKMTLLNKNDSVVLTEDLKGGPYHFHLLRTDKRTLSMLGSDDCTFLISGNLLAVRNTGTMPIANTKVQLLDEKGVMLESMVTNNFGTFVFSKAPADQNFVVQLADHHPELSNVKVIITDHDGREINSTICDNNGQFNFEFLKQDELKFEKMEVEESSLLIDFKGKLFKNSAKKAFSNATVDLIDEKDNVVQTVSTDKSGNFRFSKVPYEHKYTIAASGDGIQRVILTDSKGIVINEYNAGKMVKTVRFPLLPAEQQKLLYVALNDPWESVTISRNEITIPEKVYFASNEYRISRQEKIILDKVIHVMKNDSAAKVEIGSHTDSQGSSEYNLELSRKRAESAVEYIVSYGIKKARVTGVGYGETKLINRCSDGIQCSEEEHAQNRRLEFKFTFVKQ